MKLKTEIHEGKLGFFDINTVYHDAAYAHALVMAAKEIEPDEDYRFCTMWQSVQDRADELMREWGYS